MHPVCTDSIRARCIKSEKQRKTGTGNQKRPPARAPAQTCVPGAVGRPRGRNSRRRHQVAVQTRSCPPRAPQSADYFQPWALGAAPREGLEDPAIVNGASREFPGAGRALSGRLQKGRGGPQNRSAGERGSSPPCPPPPIPRPSQGLPPPRQHNRPTGTLRGPRVSEVP